MRLVFLGPPGSGKGTQARLFQERLGVPQISTGDIFRKAIAARTPLGTEVEKYISSGALVPDAITVQLVTERLSQKDAANGFILDGFPRTIPQAVGTEEMLSRFNWSIDAVVNIEVPIELLVRRLNLRRTCPACGKMYHLEGCPPGAEGICDECGGALQTRADDSEETVRRRLDVYFAQTAPLVDFYREKSRLVCVDGTGSVRNVFQDISDALSKKRGGPKV
ncbi:MAG: adenylate kinase [Candidatus Eisenbacteria bacterium]